MKYLYLQKYVSCFRQIVYLASLCISCLLCGHLLLPCESNAEKPANEYENWVQSINDILDEYAVGSHQRSWWCVSSYNSQE